MYKYQHLYVPILYGLLSLRSRLLDVFDVFLKETNGPVKVNQISLQDKLRQASSKLLWLFWRYYLTFHIFGMDNVAKYGTTEQWPMEWAVLQIKSSADYSHGNWLMTYLSGALNYQVIHHLFPGVSQYLYPEIAPIFLEVCKKYNLNYNLLPGFKEVLNGHVNHLKNMSKQVCQKVE